MAEVAVTVSESVTLGTARLAQREDVLSDAGSYALVKHIVHTLMECRGRSGEIL
jgi:hypothetical protein